MNTRIAAADRDARPRALSGRATFGLLGGPLAWFAQLLVGSTLASAPCFPHDQRLLAPPAPWSWTHAGIVGMLLLCAVVALAAFGVAWRDLRRGEGGATYAGRARFVALWGAALGGGFCVATLLTAVGIALLPRCAG